MFLKNKKNKHISDLLQNPPLNAEFNIIEAVEEMMSIEIDKAKIKGVNLYVEYVNIGNNQYIPTYSPIMKSDVGRIQ